MSLFFMSLKIKVLKLCRWSLWRNKHPGRLFVMLMYEKMKGLYIKTKSLLFVLTKVFVGF